LIGHKRVQLTRKALDLFLGSHTIRSSQLISVLGLLEQAGDPNFHKLVEIAGSDGEKLHAL